MFYNAKNKEISVNGFNMSYCEFGEGFPLILLPGLSDGITSVRGKALPLAYSYRELAKHFKCYMFSRRDSIPEGFTIDDMADDLHEVLTALSIENTHVLGVSQGGMVALRFCVKYPAMVDKLIIAVSASKVNNLIDTTINAWLNFAANSDYKSIFIDTAEKSYTEKKLKQFRPLYPLLYRIEKPKNLSRFIIQAKAILKFDTYNELEKIKNKTLIIGGSDDKIVGVDVSIEMSEKISGSELFIYEGLGHAAYEEAKDFNERVIRFLTK
ncbi:MAG: alpha/beta hydrolase [Ruminococcus sp.]|jgi:pimeloyl-ACP methyl ester carboxylesterase|nr:alpha/beta hydrolase [Ruminococcus sp.]